MKSLQARLGLGLLISLLSAFVILWLIISSSIRYLAEDYILSRLTHDAETLLAAIKIGNTEEVTTDLSQVDSVYHRPFSGHYYTIKMDSYEQRSRSLWDQSMAISSLQSGDFHKKYVTGPQKQKLLLLVRGFKRQAKNITIAVAEDFSPIESDINKFQRKFSIAAVLILILLMLLQAFILSAGLRPLSIARKQLGMMERGEINHLNERVPSEIKPMVREINRLFGVLTNRLQRSRDAMGDLAHSIKKPLTVIQQLTTDEKISSPADFRIKLSKQVVTIQQLTDRILKRARLAGEGPSGIFFSIQNDLYGLVDTLKLMHRDKNIEMDLHLPETAVIAFDRDDIMELLGNVLDNACKWAIQNVKLSMFVMDANAININIEDDGAGVNEDEIIRLARRGIRLDETINGHGLGLAIASDIVDNYHGNMQFSRSKKLGGFMVTISLPINIMN